MFNRYKNILREYVYLSNTSRFFRYILISVIYLLMIFCCIKPSIAVKTSHKEQEIKLGVTSGVHEQIAEIVRDISARNGLHIKIIPFSDFFQLNPALQNRSLDVNSFQHQLYLDQQIKNLGYQIVSVGKTFNLPMGMYSKNTKSLSQLKIGAKIAIPNDPSNEGRALLLLQKYDLIKLRQPDQIDATPSDIVYNPKKFCFEELDAAQLPYVLSDVDAAIINTDYALLSNLNPLKDSIAHEDSDSPYFNIIAVREEDKEKPWINILIKAYQSKEVRNFIEKEFHGALVLSGH